jgi:NADPH-dependent 2,4-dienoyl-CoA reductase/sulfur reductase-like enzyme/peroxiredoxin family protein/rhodanese-related sulfurtransferase/TusA-related sulfurtransferase
MKKIIIVGGVAGGATTAARLRRLDEKLEIILVERGSYISYANCGLPYYIGGSIADRNKLFVTSAEQFRKRYNIDIRVDNEVFTINRTNKQVEIKNLQTGETYSEEYDYLVLSPGAEPVRPPIPGIENEGIFTLRNVPDTDRIKEYVDTKKPKRAVVIGAGFIGLEMAENLYDKGIFVTIVEMAEQVMTVLDYEMAAGVHQHLKTKNVEFYLKDGVSSFNKKDGALEVVLNSGRVLTADMIILSIGVAPEKKLAQEADLELTDRGAIVVNKYLQTSDQSIYALGDAIAFEHPIIKKKLSTYLAGPANKQGRIVADNIINGNTKEYKGAIATAIAKVFDITVASTGLSEKILEKEGIKYVSSITHSSSHAGYYPGATAMTVKIVFDEKDGKIFGAQIVGYNGVDKRIDSIAAILGKNGTIYDLQEFEHAYAPPYSSAKDPVNMAGFVAENIIDKKVKIIHWNELLSLNKSDIFLLDVRTVHENQLGSITGSINMPVDELRDRINEIPKNKKIIIFCAVGLRGYLAYRILAQNGFKDIYNLSGGYKTYGLATSKQSNEDIFGDVIIGKDDLMYQSGKVDSIVHVDACGLQCPGPILKLKEEIDKLSLENEIEIIATDQGFFNDAKAWCRMTGNELISIKSEQGKVIVRVKKKLVSKKASDSELSKTLKDQTIVVFSNDLDKALAAFIIANGAAAAGKKITMFFTFWGLTILRKKRIKKRVKKDLFAKMFSFMLPKGVKKLTLSKLHMKGLGTLFMKIRMKLKNIDSLESLIESAHKNGVKIIACQMTMDMMGIAKEELIDLAEIGGVATYIESSESANSNLFI